MRRPTIAMSPAHLLTHHSVRSDYDSRTVETVSSENNMYMLREWHRLLSSPIQPHIKSLFVSRSTFAQLLAACRSRKTIRIDWSPTFAPCTSDGDVALVRDPTFTTEYIARYVAKDN